MYAEDYDPQIIHHLSQLLFMKRKSASPAGHSHTAFAPEAETARAILSVLRVRRAFLETKNIHDLGHELTEPERGEISKRARDVYEATPPQLALQDRDRDKGIAKSKTGKQDARGARGSRGARQPAGKGSKAQPAGNGSKGKGPG